MQYISTRSDDRHYSFKEAAIMGRCPAGGIFLPFDFAPLDDSFWEALAGRDFWSKLAHCLAYFIDELSPVEADLLVRSAYVEDLFGPQPLKARLLNPYKPGELLVLAEQGPTGSRRDYANYLALKLMEEWLESDICPIFYAGPDLSSLLSLAHSLHDYPEWAGLYFVDRRLDQAALERLENYLRDTRSLGFRIDDVPANAESAVLRNLTDPELLAKVRSAGLSLLPADGSSVISLVCNLSLLLTAFSDFADQGVLQEGEVPDICLAASDLDLVLACLYLKGMGLGLGQIILAENSNRTYSNFFRSARFRACQNYRASLAPCLDQVISPSLEALLFELLGRNYAELAKARQDLLDQGQFRLDPQYRLAWNQHVSAIFSHDKTLLSQCRSLYDTTDYLMDAGSCACFAARSLQNRRRQYDDYFIVLSSENPLWSPDLAAEALYNRSFSRGKTPDEIAQAVVEESSIPYPAALRTCHMASQEAKGVEGQPFQRVRTADLDQKLAELISRPK